MATTKYNSFKFLFAFIISSFCTFSQCFDYNNSTMNETSLAFGFNNFSSDLIVKCNEDIDCKDMFFCDKQLQRCQHKSIFPMTFSEIVIFLLVSVSYGISNLCGIGGGAAATSLIMWVENFSTSEAVPISMAVMLVSTIWTYCLGAKFKKENPESDFVDYQASAIIIPLMLLGSKIGTIINFVFPFLLTSILLILFTSYTMVGIYKKYMTQLKTEQSEKSKNEPLVNRPRDRDLIMLQDKSHSFKTSKTTPTDDIFTRFALISNSFSPSINDLTEEDKVNLSKLDCILAEDNDPLSKKWLYLLSKTFMVYLLDLLIEGNIKFESILGIKMCSNLYYFLFYGVTIILVYIVKYNREYIKANHELKKRLDHNYTNPKEEIFCTQNNNHLYISFIGGLLSGSLGIGGGLIVTPFMLSLGFSPKTSTTTASLLIIFSSLSSTIMFAMMGSLDLGFAIVLVIPCFLSCYLCSKYVNNYIKKTGKQSILLAFLLFLCFISIVFILFSIRYRANYNYEHNISLFTFNEYCAK